MKEGRPLHEALPLAQDLWKLMSDSIDLLNLCEKESEDANVYAQEDIEVETEDSEEIQNLEFDEDEDEIELNPAWSSLNLLGLPLITLNEDSMEEENEEEQEEEEVIIAQTQNNNKRKRCRTLGLRNTKKAKYD